MGGIVIPLIVLASTLGAANASIIGGARVAFVAARSGHLPHGLAVVSSDSVAACGMNEENGFECLIWSLNNRYIQFEGHRLQLYLYS